MAKIILNNKEYTIADSTLASALTNLQSHLSTTMSGEGAVINLGGVAYNVDSTKLSTAANAFTSRLGTIAGEGAKIVINGTEYSIDSTKIADAVTVLGTAFGELEAGGSGGVVHSGVIPEGATYTTGHVWSEDEWRWDESNVTTLEAGSNFPDTATPGDIYTYGDYMYCYGYPWSSDEGDWNGYSRSEHWCVRVSDTSKSSYGEILSRINNIDVVGNAGAFSDCRNLTTVVFPAGITEIGTAMFRDCDSLTSVVIPDSVTRIESEAFNSCDKLTDVTLGNNVTRLGWYAFGGAGLTSIVIPNSVTYISNMAFSGCSSLTSVVIGDSVTSIEAQLFFNCSSLTSVVIGNGVTSIDYEVFSGCSSLTNITFNGTMAQWDAIDKYEDEYTSWIGENVPATFVQCSDGQVAIYEPEESEGSAGLEFTSNGDGTCYVSGIGTCTDSDLVIPAQSPEGDDVTSIGDNVFDDCHRFTSVVIPDSVTTIGNGAFANSNSLTSVVIGDSVTSIGYMAFNNCNSLISVVIGDSVTSIGEYVFNYCVALTDITFNGTMDQWVAIRKGEGWNSEVPATYAQCSDGLMHF